MTYKPRVLTVADGGSGLSSATAYAVLCGGTTATGALQSIAAVGTSGQVLTSNGAGALPTFQTSGAVSSFTPTISFGGASVGVTYAVQQGRKSVIGNTVSFQIQIELTSKGSSTGTLAINGLTDTSASGISQSFNAYMNVFTVPSSQTSYIGLIGPSSTSFNILGYGNGSGASVFSNTNVSNTTTFIIAGTYFSA